MAVQDFIFGGNTGVTYEELKRRQAVAAAMLQGQAGSAAPRNVGEGLNAIGQALAYRVAKGKAGEAEAVQKDKQKGIWDALGGALGGAATSPAYGTMSGGAAGGDGRYTVADIGKSSALVSTRPGDENIYGDFINTVKAGDADLGLAGISNPFGLAAVASTGKRESGYSAKNTFGSWSDPSESGQAGTAGGVMSWRAERLANMRSFASKAGDDPNRPSAATQAKFFLAEDPSLVARLNNAKSVEEAQSLMNKAWAFAGHDRPGGEAAERFKTANAYLPTFMGGDQQAAATAPPAPVQVASLDPSAGMTQMPANPATAMAGPNPKTAAVAAALGPDQQAPQQPQGMTPVAAALAGQPPMPTAGPQSPAAAPAPDQWAGMRAAPQPMPQQAQPQQMAQAPQGGQGGPNAQVLLRVLSDPWASPEQKQVASSLLEQSQERSLAAEKRYYDRMTEAEKRQYEEQVRQQGYQREDARFGVTDRREDARLGLEVSAADREARKPIEVGGVLVDPNTMKPVYQAPDKPTGNMQEYDAYAADEKAAGRQPVGRLVYEQSLRRAGAQTTTIQNGGNSSKFGEKSDEAAAKRLDDIVQGGNAASQTLGDVQQLADLGKQIGTGLGAQAMVRLGPYAEALGVSVEGLGPAQAYQSIIAHMAPQMRPAGAGATSDFDARQFLQSLPSLGNTPEGNAIINDTFAAVQQNMLQAAEIASQAYLSEADGGITWQEAEKRIRTLPNPYERFKATRKVRGDAPPARTTNPKPDTTPRDQGGVPLGGSQTPIQRARNPQTGELLELRNGNWVVVQ